MENNREYYYDISKWYLMLVGQWPYQKLKESLFFLIFILFLETSALVTQIAKFVICDNAQCIYETLPPHMLTVMILVKIFTYQFNSRKVCSINMNDVDISNFKLPTRIVPLQKKSS
ncbi:PREDICTED: uncharacterized protein LOC105621283 [Atta cephalotes]|uniref:Uncharacterized protein n=1 Tax=Atta cephalotes TaxID=12957 RepID=A0A158NKT3_ATTCE|nr:PREDICTED: uncharacterized protein LOC105621283 [Atta cephalotes]